MNDASGSPTYLSVVYWNTPRHNVSVRWFVKCRCALPRPLASFHLPSLPLDPTLCRSKHCFHGPAIPLRDGCLLRWSSVFSISSLLFIFSFWFFVGKRVGMERLLSSCNNDSFYYTTGTLCHHNDIHNYRNNNHRNGNHHHNDLICYNKTIANTNPLKVTAPPPSDRLRVHDSMLPNSEDYALLSP